MIRSSSSINTSNSASSNNMSARNTITGGGTTVSGSGNKSKAFRYTSSGSSPTYSKSTADKLDDANYNPKTGGISPQNEGQSHNTGTTLAWIICLTSIGFSTIFIWRHNKKSNQ